METTIKTDAIIVGAGPTGLSLAVQLMCYDIDFVIFDKKEGVTDLSKALVVHARTLEIYDQVGLAQKAVEGGEIVQKGAVIHDGKITTRLNFSDFGGRLSPFPFLLVFALLKNERLLYKEERLANAKRLLQTTDQFFKSRRATSKWYLRFIRDNILPSLAGFVMQFGAAKEFVFPMISQIGLNYRDSSLSWHQGDREFEVKAGDRMPYFLVDGANVYDKLRDPKFHLLVFSDGEQGYGNLKLELENEYGDLIDFNVIPLYPSVLELFGTNRPFKVLLRPDNYIGLISTHLCSDDLKAYFNTRGILI